MVIVRLSATIHGAVVPAVNVTNAPAMTDAPTLPPFTEAPDARDRLDTVRLVGPSEVRDALDQLEAATIAHLEASRAENTRRAYASDVGSFELWCGQYGL